MWRFKNIPLKIRERLYSLCRYYSKIGVLGIPFERGQGKTGPKEAPALLRQNKLIDRLKDYIPELDIKDYGNVEYGVDPNNKIECIENIDMENFEHISACMCQTSIMVQNIICDGRVPFSLGGDHSVALGTISGHLRVNPNLCVIWIDAHADINSNLTSTSRNVHGMVLFFLIKELEKYRPNLSSLTWIESTLSIKNLAYIGLRSVDPYERLIINKFNIVAFTMADIIKCGIMKCIERALEQINPQNEKSIHISFDIDVLDPLEAASTGTPGGLQLREGVRILEHVYDTGKLAAIDLVEVNPKLATKEDVQKTIEAAIILLQAASGWKIHGISPPGVNDIPMNKNK